MPNQQWQWVLTFKTSPPRSTQQGVWTREKKSPSLSRLHGKCSRDGLWVVYKLSCLTHFSKQGAQLKSTRQRPDLICVLELQNEGINMLAFPPILQAYTTTTTTTLSDKGVSPSASMDLLKDTQAQLGGSKVNLLRFNAFGVWLLPEPLLVWSLPVESPQKIQGRQFPTDWAVASYCSSSRKTQVFRRQTPHFSRNRVGFSYLQVRLSKTLNKQPVLLLPDWIKLEGRLH